MSNLSIFLVCGLIILTAWLVRKYQDKQLNVNKKTSDKTKKSTGYIDTFLRNQPKDNFITLVKNQFPNLVIKQGKEGADTVFLSKQNQPENVLVIIKLEKYTEETQSTKTNPLKHNMGDILRLTYYGMPNAKQLKKDVMEHIE